MKSVDYKSVIQDKDVKRFPISTVSTESNLTGSWRFSKPVFREKVSPCSVGCPANTNIPRYINFLLKNDMNSAVEVLRRENPFPATCGRVCPHFCQLKCNRAQFDGAVQIKEIEKFVGDYALNIPFNKPQVISDKKIAIVGGGPAGLSCAYFLAINGYRVELFEKEGFLGGLLAYGIPQYRLPRDIVNKEIENILSLGSIDVHLNESLDIDGIEELSKRFDAVFVAIGLSKDKVPDNITIDNKVVFSGYELLKQINTNKIEAEAFSGKRVGIIGGGNVAFDVARTILRLGGDVEILYRRTLAEAPAFEDEKTDAKEEGVKIRERVVVESMEKAGNSGLRLRLRGVDRIENNRPVFNETRQDLDVDSLIVATGQARSFDLTCKDNVLAGGDYEHGARTVIEAIASGKKAAYRIMAYLEGKEFHLVNEDDNFFRARNDFDEYKVVGFERINLAYFENKEPLVVKKLEPERRKNNFKEVTLKPSLEEILNEAKRCFSCGVCNGCKTCWFFCPDMCINVQGKVEFDYNYCKGCGVCSQECPRGVIDMVEDK